MLFVRGRAGLIEAHRRGYSVARGQPAFAVRRSAGRLSGPRTVSLLFIDGRNSSEPLIPAENQKLPGWRLLARVHYLRDTQ